MFNWGEGPQERRARWRSQGREATWLRKWNWVSPISELRSVSPRPPALIEERAVAAATGPNFNPPASLG